MVSFRQKCGYLRRTSKYGLKFLIESRKTHVLLACFPKSGSSFLNAILAQIPQFKKVNVSNPQQWFSRAEQELAQERLVMFHHCNYVAQQHVRHSKSTQDFIDDFDLKPVVLVRNIFDTVVSLLDYISLDKFKRPDELHNNIVMPMIYSNREILKKIDGEKRFEFLIDLAVPWYIHFFVSWNDCTEKKLVTYEDLTSDSFTTVKHLLKKLNLSDSDNNIREYINRASKAPTLKNVAMIGRGDILPTKLKDRVKRFAGYYPNVDFSPIGIDL